MADDEAKLLARLKRRDEAAFNELVRQHQARVYQLVYRMLGDPAEAEDVAQEVFVSVFKSIASFRGDSKLGTWIYRVATNHCKNRIQYLGRRAHRAKREFDETKDGSTATVGALPRPDALVQAKQTEGLIHRALHELDQEQRELVVLRDVQNLSYEEIQRITGLAEGTVKSRLHRARKTLQARVAELGAPNRESKP